MGRKKNKRGKEREREKERKTRTKEKVTQKRGGCRIDDRHCSIFCHFFIDFTQILIKNKLILKISRKKAGFLYEKSAAA